MPSTQQSVLFTLFAILAVIAQIQPVKADAGNVIAGLLGGFMAFIVICAILGWWSRRGNPQSTSGEGQV